MLQQPLTQTRPLASDIPICFKPRPFLKWAGGKQQLLEQFEPLFPQHITRYFEPFAGSAAVFFHLSGQDRILRDAFLFDSNADLINCYRVVRDHLTELLELLAEHKARHNTTYYYQVRAQDISRLTPIQQAARTIYLNKTCYNGLYRVNRRGQFNVPIGDYSNPGILDEEALRDASLALQRACIEKQDFRSVIDLVCSGDFLYLDPPYYPLTATANFTSYTPDDFGTDDQRDLAELCRLLDRHGCQFMLSNSYTPFILDLYRDFRIETVQAARFINSKSNGRGKIKEVVVLNY